MLTVDFDRLWMRPGLRLLDVGCGQGRHAFEALRRGAAVVVLDRDAAECKELGAQDVRAVNSDVLRLPFPDASFDRIVAAEVLEHVDDDRRAMAELARILRPGGLLAVTVPRWFPEQVCWALSSDYHAPAVPGGHVRIYRRRQLVGRLRAAGLRPLGGHHAHALHSPYWWLKCVVGVGNGESWPVRQYHRFLVWDIMRPNRWVRGVERVLNPVLGKSLVVYCERPC